MDERSMLPLDIDWFKELKSVAEIVFCCNGYAVHGLVKYKVRVKGVPGCNCTPVKLLTVTYCNHSLPSFSKSFSYRHPVYFTPEISY